MDEFEAGIFVAHVGDDRTALRPAVVNMLVKCEGIIDRRKEEFLAVGAARAQD